MRRVFSTDPIAFGLMVSVVALAFAVIFLGFLSIKEGSIDMIGVPHVYESTKDVPKERESTITPRPDVRATEEVGRFT